ncbi:hypothetical protein LG943_02700 [Streptomonospora sp. S1-112]|uniref:Uncharacterized protein n=1 Tax=Streptomonospora mangrovi TaxID=2883123 RepID=A0A9X3NK23_9ACTN|nr:hypothetical protein [Streptomonospora mangrovi]MDA0563244.1 hypothetical protein [Streptomonospora mangrovi]
MTSDHPRPSSVVALLADIPTTGHLGGTQAARFALDGHDLAGQAGAFVEFARYHTAQGAKVVALYPRWRGEPARRAVAFARGALLSDSVAAVGMDLSPLALSLIADQLAYLSPYLPPGMIAGLADELPRHTLAGGWLRNVANLATIPISVRQHLGSFAPGVTYLAVCSPVPQVGRVNKADPASVVPFRPQEPVQVLHSCGDNVDPSAFEEQFLPVMRAVAVRRLPPQPLGSLYWGSAKYVEFVAFSAHPRALTDPARSVRPTTCSWCGEPAVGPACRFCGAAAGASSAGRTRPPQAPAQPSPGAPAPVAAPHTAPTRPPHPAPAAPHRPQGSPPAHGPAPAHHPAPTPAPAHGPAPHPVPGPPPATGPGAPHRPPTAPHPGPDPAAPQRPRPRYTEPIEDEDLPVPQELPPLHGGPADSAGPPESAALAGPAPAGAAPSPPAPADTAPPGYRLQSAPHAASLPVSALPHAHHRGGGVTGADTGPRAAAAGPAAARPAARSSAASAESADDDRAHDLSIPRAPK